MAHPLLRRVVRLEEAGRSSWQSWLSRPLMEWPDEMLARFICESEGISLPPGSDASSVLTDERLRLIQDRAAHG